jgi:hypothetical protein
MHGPYRGRAETTTQLVVARRQRRWRAWHVMLMTATVTTTILIALAGGAGIAAGCGPVLIGLSLLAIDTTDDAERELGELPFPIEHDRPEWQTREVIGVNVRLRDAMGVTTAVGALPHGVRALVKGNELALTGNVKTIAQLADLMTTWGAAVHAAFGIEHVDVAWSKRFGPPMSL